MFMAHFMLYALSPILALYWFFLVISTHLVTRVTGRQNHFLWTM